MSCYRWLVFSFLLVSASGLYAQALPTAADGFRVKLIGREPLVRNPCSMAFDSSGRLFVGMGPQYRNPTPDTPGDSVVLLTDRDGDGKLDHRHVFASGLNCIQSIAWHGRDLWIANAPDLTVVRDLDHDDIADEYVLMYTDLGNLEHGLHGLNWGPDGRLYMSKGNSKGLTLPGRIAPLPFRELWGVKSPPGAPDYPPPKTFQPSEYRRSYHDPRDDWGREGGVLVCDADGSHLEIVSRGFRNPWDIAFDSGFHWQGTDNDQDRGDRVFMPFFGSHFGWGHHWSAHWTGEGHLPTAPISGPVFHGSGTGIVYYDAPQFPQAYRGIWIFNDWFRRTTLFYRPQWQGALLHSKAPQWSTLLEAGDSLFKPTDLEVGPDGALYVLGWGTEYGLKQDKDGKMINEGRIFRVSWGGSPQTSMPTRPLATDRREWSIEQLVDEFAGPLPAWRIAAQNELLRRGVTPLVPQLSSPARPLREDQQTWLVWTIGRGSLENTQIDQQLGMLVLRHLAAPAGGDHLPQGGSRMANSLNLTIQCLRILADRRRRGGHSKVLEQMLPPALGSNEARVRMAAVQAMRRVKTAGVLEQLIGHLQSEDDRVVFYCCWQLLGQRAEKSQRVELLGDARDRVRLAALLSLAEQRVVPSERLADLLADESEDIRNVAGLWLAKSRGSSLLEVSPPGGEFRGQQDVQIRVGIKPARVYYTLDGTEPSADSAVYSGSLTITRSTQLKLAVYSNDRQIGETGTYEFRRLSVAEAASRSGILSVVSASGAPYRIVDGGLRAGSQVYTDRAYKYVEVPKQLQGAMVVQTANDDSDREGDRLLTLETAIPLTVSLAIDVRLSDRPRWMNAGKPGGFQPSGETIKTNDTSFEVFEKSFPLGRIELGASVDRGNQQTRSHYLLILSPAGLPRLSQPTQLEAVLPLLEQANPQRGKALFYASGGAGCAACHRLDNQPGGFGPRLSELTKNRDPRHVVRSMLKPSAEIKEGYSLQQIVTDDGKLLQGLLRDETATALTILQSDGKTAVVRKDEVDERHSKKQSPMPSYANILTAEQVADLTAWLLSAEK